jgi:hypothetical protein
MRDLQRLEELSNAAALGLWADDVILALCRAIEATGPDEGDTALLTTAATVLDATRERAEQPTALPKSAQSLAATDAALDLAVSLTLQQVQGDEPEDTEGVSALLSSLADLLRKAAEGQLVGSTADTAIAPAADFFGRLGEMQLVESSSVLTSRKNGDTWTAMHKTSSFC